MPAVQGALGERPAVITGQVSFFSDSVCILVSQSHSNRRDEYNAARSQCWLRMLACPPCEFDVKLTGSASCPVIEVSVYNGLVGKLPLLSEVSENTDPDVEVPTQSDKEIIPADNKENVYIGNSGGRTAELRLPCSVWGVVSLLLVLDKNINIEPWFDDVNSDPRLPEETLLVFSRSAPSCCAAPCFVLNICLASSRCSAADTLLNYSQAAEFLGCDEIRSNIIKWLRAALVDVSLHGANAASGTAAATSLNQSCPRVWHRTEVPFSFTLFYCVLIGSHLASVVLVNCSAIFKPC